MLTATTMGFVKCSERLPETDDWCVVKIHNAFYNYDEIRLGYFNTEENRWMIQDCLDRVGRSEFGPEPGYLSVYEWMIIPDCEGVYA